MDTRKLKLKRQFLEDFSFELFIGSRIFKMMWQPKIEVDVAVGHKKNEDNEYEVYVRITTSVELEGQPAFLVEVKQTGIFEIADMDSDSLEKVLEIACPTFLFPYAREITDNLSVRAGMLPIALQPFNFEELYQISKSSQS